MNPINFTPEDVVDFNKGIELFNEQHYWHAHEAWEAVWRRHPEQERLFFQGLIQLAAAYHHYMTKRSFTGMVNNFKKAQAKLELFTPEYCTVRVAPLMNAIRQTLEACEQCLSDRFEELTPIALPRIEKD